MILLWVAPAIGAAASLAGTAISAGQTGRMNKRSERFSWNMYNQQRKDAYDDWHNMNAYNSPEQQMSRMKDAGLNPNLMYGHGTGGDAGSVRPSSVTQARFQAPQYDIGGVVQSALNARALDAQIARTEAETDRIKQQTDTGQFDLSVKKAVGFERLARELDNRVVSSDVRTAKESREFDEWMKVAFDDMRVGEITVDKFGSYIAGDNSLIRKAMSAGLQKTVVELENLRKAGTLRDDQHSLNQVELQIKDFTRRLADLGVSPGSTQALQVVVSLLRTVFGK